MENNTPGDSLMKRTSARLAGNVPLTEDELAQVARLESIAELELELAQQRSLDGVETPIFETEQFSMRCNGPR
jgi:hypothetical protein